MKTRKVIDETYTKDEGQECFVGTLQECEDFVTKQNTIGLKIVPMTPDEIVQHNNLLETVKNAVANGVFGGIPSKYF